MEALILVVATLELTKDTDVQHIGLRFSEINIPQGTKITSAYIQFTCDEKSEESTELMIAIQDTADAASFAEIEENVSSRNVLADKVKWTPKKWDKEGARRGVGADD